MVAELERVLRVIPEGEAPRRDEFVTSQGVVFRVRPVPPMLQQDVRRRFLAEQPVPPKIKNDEKETLEENPSDPDYLRQMDAFYRDLGEAATAVLLTRGLELVELGGCEGPDDTEWAEDVRDITRLEVPEKGRRRFYCWLKYVALATQRDLQEAMRRVQRVSGITTEADAAEAAESFRSDPPRAATDGVPPGEASE